MAANAVHQNWYLDPGEVADLIGMSPSWIRETELCIGLEPVRVGKGRTRIYRHYEIERLKQEARENGPDDR